MTRAHCNDPLVILITIIMFGTKIKHWLYVAFDVEVDEIDDCK